MNPPATTLVTPPRDAGGVGSRQRGSVSVELAILSVPLILLIVLAIVTGRTEIAYNALTVAAHDAARAASISRTAQLAEDEATAVAHATLAEQGLSCQALDVQVVTDQFARPVGEPAAVTVTISCDLNFGDLGLGFTRQVEATFASPIDTFRGRA